MQPLQISAETALMLSKKLNVPIEHLMHMPKPILLQRIAELAKADSAAEATNESAQPQVEDPSEGNMPS